MKLTENQAKLVNLTMELDLKAREYKKLCKELDKLKEANIDPNSPTLIPLRDKFAQNLKEIQEINRKLKELKGE